MTCEKCGHANAPSQTSFCEQCGASLSRRPPRAETLLRRCLLALGGGVFGISCTAVIWVMGTVAFARVGLRSEGQVGVSQGIAWFDVATLLVPCLALITLFVRPVARKLDGDLRTFLFATFFVMLGGMSLCNSSSDSSLFSKYH